MGHGPGLGTEDLWESSLPHGPSLGVGNTLSRGDAGHPYSFPRVCPPRDGPPDARGPLEVLVGPFTDFSDFLGSNSSHSRVLFTRLLVYIYGFFFQMMSSGGIG